MNAKADLKPFDTGALEQITENVRIPTKPDGDSDFEAGHRSDLKPDAIPI